MFTKILEVFFCKRKLFSKMDTSLYINGATLFWIYFWSSLVKLAFAAASRASARDITDREDP